MTGRPDLEKAVSETVLMATLATKFVCETLGFEDTTNPPTLNPVDASLLAFVLMETRRYALQAQEVFYSEQGETL